MGLHNIHSWLIPTRALRRGGCTLQWVRFSGTFVSITCLGCTTGRAGWCSLQRQRKWNGDTDKRRTHSCYFSTWPLHFLFVAIHISCHYKDCLPVSFQIKPKCASPAAMAPKQCWYRCSETVTSSVTAKVRGMFCHSCDRMCDTMFCCSNGNTFF